MAQTLTRKRGADGASNTARPTKQTKKARYQARVVSEHDHGNLQHTPPQSQASNADQHADEVELDAEQEDDDHVDDWEGSGQRLDWQSVSYAYSDLIMDLPD